jgi:stearoyl-CoA desaturase (delta-9 desaturase)
VVPTVIAGWGWGDWWGGYFVAGVARLVFVHHSTFCVNSLAHWVGDATYTDGHTARNSIVTAVVTLGEGYHNFHHEFPNDYRNGVEWWQYDPTKIFIYCASLLGLAYDLRVFPQEVIVKGQLQMKQKALDAKMGKLSWGPNPASLQVLSKRQFEEHVAEGKRWVTLDGFVLDVSLFAKDHPGGEGLLQDKVGQDVSQLFKGQAYKHSNAAHNVAHTLRVARIEGHWAR